METKKILTIPDLHGKTTWKHIFDSIYDYIVFLGDYVDDYNKSDEEILQNFIEVIELKKTHPDKVILLIGNHDLQYMFISPYYRCSGYRPDMSFKLNQLFTLNRHLFQFAFQYKNHIWSHAGIHRGWWEFIFKGVNGDDVALQLNNEFDKKRLPFVESKVESLFDCGWDRGGSQKIGGPLWVDKNTLWLKGISNYHQIVGHSKVKQITTCEINKKKVVNGSITFCDCLDTIDQFHIIEI